MQKLIARIFRQYGVPMQVQLGDTQAMVYGFVHYTATSARKHLLPNYTSLGQVPPGHCRILLPHHSVAEGDLLNYDSTWYVIRLVERVWLGNKAIYDRCLCEERGAYDQWDK